jgi:hypothetical protein
MLQEIGRRVEQRAKFIPARVFNVSSLSGLAFSKVNDVTLAKSSVVFALA